MYFLYSIIDQESETFLSSSSQHCHYFPSEIMYMKLCGKVSQPKVLPLLDVVLWIFHWNYKKYRTREQSLFVVIPLKEYYQNIPRAHVALISTSNTSSRLQEASTSLVFEHELERLTTTYQFHWHCKILPGIKVL